MPTICFCGFSIKRRKTSPDRTPHKDSSGIRFAFDRKDPMGREAAAGLPFDKILTKLQKKGAQPLDKSKKNKYNMLGTNDIKTKERSS